MHLVSDTLKPLESHVHSEQRFISHYFNLPQASLGLKGLIKSCGVAVLKELLSLSDSGLWVYKKRGGRGKEEEE